MPEQKYQVGGSLSIDHPTYVMRNADHQLYNALIAGEFCYILNSRQVGKSSLMLKTLHRLRSEGCRCVSIDLTLIGSENITPAHWYNGLIAEIWRSLGLRKKININAWLKEHANVSPQQRLSYCIEDILLNQFPDERIFIFIDEADTVLSLDFASDDLFTFIRSCYNQRGINLAYHRLAFVIAGVAYPSDLIVDKNRTPFNIGRGIALQGFTKEESDPLLIGLEKVVNYPQEILEAILDWTNGQPFLTQKLCQLVVETHGDNCEEKLSIPSHLVKFFVDTLVRSQIIENWENNDQPEHLKTIVNRLSINQKILARTLGIYQQILLGEKITTDQSREQIELILSGLIIANNGYLQVKNQIYAEIFDLTWVKQQLAMLRPYSTMLEYWLKSHQTDNSRLLRGQSLIDAQNWIEGKSLSNLDYQFLAKSVEIDRAEKEKDLELSKMKEVEARLEQEKKNAYLQKILLGVSSLALFIAGSLSFTTWLQYRRYQLQELQAITLSSNALFASHQPLEALVKAIKARQKLKTLRNIEPAFQEQVQLALQKSLYGATEYNRLSSQDKFHNLAFSPDQQLIATADLTGQIILWKNTGEKITTLTKFKDRAWGVNFSPDGSRLVASSASGEIMLWQVNNQQVTPLKNLQLKEWGIWRVVFSPNSQMFVSTSNNGVIKLWDRDGELIQSIQPGIVVRGVSFSPDNKLLAMGGKTDDISIWDITQQTWHSNSLNKVLLPPDPLVHSVDFSPDGQEILSCDENGMISRWNTDGQRLDQFRGHTAACHSILFHPDGQTFITSSQDNLIKFWRRNGTLLSTWQGHQGEVRNLAISKDGKILGSASIDGNVKLWRLAGQELYTKLEIGHPLTALKISPDNQMIAVANRMGEILLWSRTGKLLQIIPAHKGIIRGLSFSPDQKTLISGGYDGNIKIWRINNQSIELVKTIEAKDSQQSRIHILSFHTDGQLFASIGIDGMIRYFQLDGTLIKSIAGCSMGTGGGFSHDGQEFAIGCIDHSVARIWDNAGNLLRTLKGHTAAVWHAFYSRDNSLIVTISADGTAKIWQRNGTLVRTLKGHKSLVWSASMSPDKQILVTSSADQTVKIWQVSDGQLLNTFNAHNGAVENVAYSHDGKFVASGSTDQIVLLWDPQVLIDSQKIFDHACDWVRNYLRHNALVSDDDRHLCDRP